MIPPKRFVQSFVDAMRGLRFVFASEQNFRVQVAVALVAIAAAWYFPLRNWEVILVILLILLVLLVEMVNTAFEYFTDLLKPRMHHYVRLVKDIMAGAVFITSLVAAIVGLIIFLPHVIRMLKHFIN